VKLKFKNFKHYAAAILIKKNNYTYQIAQ